MGIVWEKAWSATWPHDIGLVAWCELPRTPLPRTPVNRVKKKGRGCHARPSLIRLAPTERSYCQLILATNDPLPQSRGVEPVALRLRLCVIRGNESSRARYPG